MANKALLEAVNKAIEALENVKRELERAEAPQDAPVAPAPAPEPPEAQSAPEPQAAGPVPQTSKSMSEAAKLAAELCTQWKFQDELGEAMDVSMLIYACGEQDASESLDPDDPENWYVVSPDGAIGLAEDDGKSVTWLFLPLGRTMASLPKKVRKDEPWPEAAVAPAPDPMPNPTPNVPAFDIAPAPPPAPEQAPAGAALTQDPSLPESIFRDESGAYHWVYQLDMKKNPVLLLLVLIKLVAYICGGMAVIMFFATLLNHNTLAESIKAFAIVAFGIGGQEEMTSSYTDVRKIIAARKHDLIKVNNVLQHNHIYAYPHQYEFVWNYITAHCPNAKVKA